MTMPCPRCGRPFESRDARGRPRLFCSRECRSIAFSEATRMAPLFEPAGDHLRVPLCRRDGTVLGHALVSLEDEPLVRRAWSLNANGYAWRRADASDPARAQHVYLHRAVAGLLPGDARQVDHENRDKLDNRRSNLRVVSAALNAQNKPSLGGTSAHRGVRFDASRGRWVAQAQLDRRAVHIGRFATEAEALAAVTAWRRQHMPGSTE